MPRRTIERPVPVQVRLPRQLHQQVAEYADRHHVSRNDGYLLLVQAGLASEQETQAARSA